MVTKPPGLAWSSCRILLEGEPAEVDGIPAGIVGRLYVTEHSQPAVKHAFSAFEPRRVSLLALGLQQVVNQRGPDALVGAIPGESPHSIRMRQLAESCYESKQCMVCSNNWADIVLVPRSPARAQEDGFDFLVFATNLKAADVCDIVRHQSKVVVVLDLDNTLVDAMAVAVSQKDWDALHWQPCQVTTESGRELAAQYAMVMDHDPLAEAIYIMHWRLGKLCCTFKVRIRRGWERLREFLVRERSRFEVFVCSKGKQEYVQLLWHMLDPLSQLFPTTDWDWRLNSTFPDAVPRAVNKTLLSALGCTHPLDDAPPTHLACPVMCFDDCPNAYREEYHNDVMYVEEYRPSDRFTADTGSIMRQAEHRLEEFWAANYPAASSGPMEGTSEGAEQGQGEEDGVIEEGPWDQVVDGVVAMMHDMLGETLQFPEGMQEHHERFAALGQWLRQRASVRDVFGDQAYIGDVPEVLTAPVTPVIRAKAAAAAAGAASSEAAPAAVEMEQAGEAAPAAEGREMPCDSPEPLLRGGATLADGPAAATRQYAAPEMLLCVLCQPSGACSLGCSACAELAAAAAAIAQAAPTRADMLLAYSDEEQEVGSTGGWYSRGGTGSACSTPRSPAAHGGAAAGGQLSEDEDEREAEAADVFQCVEPSLQQAARDVFHMKLARLSGHAMIMVPNARSLSGCLDSGSLSLSSSPK